MSLWRSWKWSGVLARHGSLSRCQAFKLTRAYVQWAYFNMALIKGNQND